MRFTLTKLLALCALATALLFLSAAPAPAEPLPPSPPGFIWDPSHTWIFAVSCTVWKFDHSLNMPKDGREDIRFMTIFKERGVPEDHIVFLKDRAGTIANIKSSFAELLKRTRPGDSLIFYFQGHGSRDVDGAKSTYYFLNFDCNNKRDDSFFYMKDVYDIVEQHFKGARAFLIADCCCSGGLAVEASKRHTSVAYAVLASTAAHNLSTGAWTFTDSLIRGFGANPIVDRTNDGYIGLTELANYTAVRMAVIENQRSIFATFNGFDPHMRIARSATPRTDPHLGRFVEAQWNDGKWYRGEVDDAKDGKLHVVYADGGQKWLTPEQTRPYQPKEFPKGTAVEARNEADKNRWQSATVLRAFHGLHLVHFEGQNSKVEDQWEPPNAIRAK